MINYVHNRLSTYFYMWKVLQAAILWEQTYSILDTDYSVESVNKWIEAEHKLQQAVKLFNKRP